MSRDDELDARAEEELTREDPGLSIVLRCHECGEKVLLNPDGTESRTCDHSWPEDPDAPF